MNRFRMTAVGSLVLLAALGATPVMADQVYKWVDEKGVTHYGEKPPEGAKSQAVKVEDTTSSDAEDEIRALQERRSAAADAEKKQKAEAEGQKKIPLGGNADKEQMKKLCDTHRKNLDMLKTGQRLMVKDDKGNKRYLSEQEAAEMKSSSEAEVQHCDSLEKKKD